MNAKLLRCFFCAMILYPRRCLLISSKDACNITGIDEANSLGQERITSKQAGDYILHGMLSITVDRNCSMVDVTGVMSVLAFKYAINQVNKEVLNSPRVTLGYHIDDVCRSLPVTMARGIEVVSLHRPNSVCRASYLKCSNASDMPMEKDKPAVAVIGTAMSFTTIPLASLLSLYSIPQISFSASSRLLSKKDLYKSFFRTIPSDRLQIQVLLDIIKSFGWNYVFAVGADDDYGKLGITELKQQSRAYNICVSRDEYLPYQSRLIYERVKEVVTKISEEPKAKVVVLFCYPLEMGDLILREAANRSIERVWLTSEAWYRLAERIDAPQSHKQGLLSIGFRSEVLPKLERYVRGEITKEVNCDIWLRKYLSINYYCDVVDSYGDELVGNCTVGKNNCTDGKCTISSTEVAQRLLANAPGNLGKLIDAVISVGWGIRRVISGTCNSSTCAQPPQVAPDALTKEMFSVRFINEQNWTIEFNEEGDPRYATYTVQNMQVVNGAFKYVQVGTWEQQYSDERRLQLHKDSIKWPEWSSGVPQSVCSQECVPGKFVVGKTDCCWGCDDCPENYVSNSTMAEKCEPCLPGHHTIDKIKCLLTPILYLKPASPTGLSILILSGIGILITVLASAILYRLRGVLKVEETSPYLLVLSMMVVGVTFCYGPLHVLEPTDALCQGRDAFFFVLFMIYAGLLLTKTNLMTSLLESYFKTPFKGNLFAAQCLFMVFVTAVEMAAVIAWLRVNPIRVEYDIPNDAFEKWLQCEVRFNAARLVATFVPCVLLIVATFCAFRERGIEHPFYEPKFVSFTCIALCIIVVAFLPTFKYVRGIYKSMVMAFTVDVCGYTYLACLIVPKIYIALVFQRNMSARSQSEAARPNGEPKSVRKEPLKGGKASEQAQDAARNGHAVPLDDGGVYMGPPPKEKVPSAGTFNCSFDDNEYLDIQSTSEQSVL